MPKVNWRRIWADFDKWCQTYLNEKCSSCGRLHHEFPDWPDQKRKIQRLVNAQLEAEDA